MNAINPTQLRKNIYKILDQVIKTGIPVEINCHGKQLKIIAVEKKSKIKNLKPISNLIVGDPADLNNIDWSDVWEP